MSQGDGIFVSSVEGHLVTRLGTNTLIGASRDPRAPDRVTWELDAIIAIPGPEYIAHKREYDRALREGGLRKRTEAEFAAYQQALQAAAEHDRPGLGT
jgi:hypothetical protein